jgi:hypothetical protein
VGRLQDKRKIAQQGMVDDAAETSQPDVTLADVFVAV